MSVTVAAPPGRGLYVTTHDRITVDPWPSEARLFILTLSAAIVLWVVLVVTIVGLAYAAMFGAFLFLMHVGFIAHVRGNGVRLGPDQFPDLYTRVENLADRMGLEKVPETYIMQAGGALNAFATRLFRSNMMILYTDLLEACGDDQAARDMIIGHELGHIRSGHLRWHWLMAPAYLIPFLGSALSRAREYTCDRFGLASAGDLDGALLGLSILAAGGRHGRLVNREALVRQRADLDTGWMSVGVWLASHPPLAQRLLALSPALGEDQRISGAGAYRGVAIVAVMVLPLFIGSWFGIKYVSQLASEGATAAQQEDAYVAPPDNVAMAQLQAAVSSIAEFLDAEVASGRGLPATNGELRERWAAANPIVPVPIDPFDGEWLGYTRTDTGYMLWSSGPDHEPATADDIEFRYE